MTQSLIESSPQGSPALTEAGSSTPARNSPSPQTPTKGPTTNTTNNDAQASTSANPPKRKKLTPEEREARDKEAAEKKEAKDREAALKKKEREEKAAQRAAEKAKQDEEKAARMKEKEEKRKKKEEEELLKTQQREEKKKQKEEELQRIQEEKDKKARAQPTLSSFFKLPNTPKKAAPEDVVADSSPMKPEETPCEEEKATETEYQKQFKPFFIKENTRMAACNSMDEETREAKSRILDECISGARESETAFDVVKLFALPGKPPRRGKPYTPVRHIMETAYKHMQDHGGNGDAAATNAMQAAKSKLAKVPVKVIAFSQDVRPPYYGTVTYKPFALGQTRMGRVARRSTDRRLPLEYDYDSEAEWQEEEGEDVDVDDDDEELSDEDDMDGFLDDSEDSGLSRRIFANAMEPESTGLCFEDETRKGPNSSVLENKMEIILGRLRLEKMCSSVLTTHSESLETTASIDPFTSSYWEPEPKPSNTKTTPATAAANQTMPPPPTPANAFAALNGGTSADSTQAKLVKAELMNDVKKAILQNKALSKVGIIDFIFQQFRDNVSRAEVKNTLELVAEKKKGSGRMKEWDLKPGHEIAL